MFIIYNAGYNGAISLIGKKTKKRYYFKKRFVTEVNDIDDAIGFLDMTSKDINWCPTESKSLLPFMLLEDWCAGKEGRLDIKPFKTYNPNTYKELFLLK